jgi:outer membrane protein assembly factor BamB
VVRLLLLAALIVGVIAGGAGGASTEACRSAVIVSATTAKVLRGLHLPINSVVADGHGGWFVGNSRLKHLRRDGSVDETWHSAARRSLPYRLRLADGMLVRHGNCLYFAGRRRVVAVDAGTGRVLWLSPAIAGPTVRGLRATIAAVAAGSRTVYVGGTFTSLGGARRVGLAALDALTGRLLPWQAPPARDVALLALSSSRLYFSGSSGVRAVRASDGRATSFVPRARIDGPIMLAVWNRFVLLGCSSRWSYCPADSGVFDGRSGKPVHKFGFDEVLSAGAVAFHGSTAYLGTGPEGDFGGSTYLIAIDLRTGKFEPWFPKVGYYASATSIAVSGDRVFVAGSFCPGP